MAADIGTGLVITWNSTTFPMELQSVSGDGEEVAVIDTSHMGSTTARSKMPGDLRDEGSFTAEFHLDPDNVIRAGSTATVSIALPWSTDAVAPTIAGGCFVQRMNYTLPFEDKMVASYTLMWTGPVTFNVGTT